VGLFSCALGRADIAADHAFVSALMALMELLVWFPFTLFQPWLIVYFS
jgi:hypothetical protein